MARFDTTLSGIPSLLYCTYLGGDTWDMATGVASDHLGNAYITGTSYSTDFPTTSGVKQPKAASNTLFRSADGGATWIGIGHGFTAPVITSINIAQSNPAVVYAAGWGCVNRSSDGGSSWTRVTNGLPTGDNYAPNINTLAVDPSNAYIVYAGGHYTGVWNTVDGGNSWISSSTGLPATLPDVRYIVVDPTNPTTIYCECNSQDTTDGVYKSLDGGAHWSRSDSGLTGTHWYVYGLAIDPVQPATLYAGQAYFGNPFQGRVVKTTDGGNTWTPILNLPNTYVLGVDLSPSNPNIVYATSANGDVYRSTDGGPHGRILG